MAGSNFNMRAKIFTFIVAMQLVIISFLLTNIYLKKSNVLGEFAVNPISKDTIVASPEGELKYFYEPKPNKILKSEQEWIASKGKHTINSDSLNERYDYPVKKDDSTYRIITLGDSFTQGVYIDTKYNYSELLEDILNEQLKCKNIKKFEVINLGVAGYDIEYAVKRFELRGKKYDPDLLVWFLNQSDFNDVKKLSMPFVEKYRLDLKEEKPEKTESEIVKEIWIATKKHIEKNYTQEELAQRLLAELQKIHRHIDKNLLIMIASDLKMDHNEIVRKFVDESEGRAQLVRLPKYAPDLYIPKDNHPNEKGHTAIANDLFDNLTKRHFASCDLLSKPR